MQGWGWHIYTYVVEQNLQRCGSPKKIMAVRGQFLGVNAYCV